MILPLAFAERVADGRATIALVPVRQSRNARRPGQLGRRRDGRSATYTARPWVPQKGHTEPLLSRTARTTEQVATVVIGEHTTIWLSQLLYDDSPEARDLVKRAGMKDRADFADRWMRHYDPEWPVLIEELCPQCAGNKTLPNGQECNADGCDPVGVILVERKQKPGDTEERFRDRHGDTEVHVVHLALADDAARFLAPAPRGDEHGYTTTRDALDAGAVPPRDFQLNLAADAFERDEKTRQDKIEKGDLVGLGQTARNRRRARSRPT